MTALGEGERPRRDRRARVDAVVTRVPVVLVPAVRLVLEGLAWGVPDEQVALARQCEDLVAAVGVQRSDRRGGERPTAGELGPAGNQLPGFVKRGEVARVLAVDRVPPAAT